MGALGYYNPGFYGNTYIPGACACDAWSAERLTSICAAAAACACLTRAGRADGGLCANGGVYMNGMCLPPTQEYIYGGVGAVVRVQQPIC